MLRERNKNTLEYQSNLPKAINLGAGSYGESDISMGKKIPLGGAEEVVRTDSSIGEVAARVLRERHVSLLYLILQTLA